MSTELVIGGPGRNFWIVLVGEYYTSNYNLPGLTLQDSLKLNELFKRSKSGDHPLHHLSIEVYTKQYNTINYKTFTVPI